MPTDGDLQTELEALYDDFIAEVEPMMKPMMALEAINRGNDDDDSVDAWRRSLVKLRVLTADWLAKRQALIASVVAQFDDVGKVEQERESHIHRQARKYAETCRKEAP